MRQKESPRIRARVGKGATRSRENRIHTTARESVLRRPSRKLPSHGPKAALMLIYKIFVIFQSFCRGTDAEPRNGEEDGLDTVQIQRD